MAALATRLIWSVVYATVLLWCAPFLAASEVLVLAWDYPARPMAAFHVWEKVVEAPEAVFIKLPAGWYTGIHFFTAGQWTLIGATSDRQFPVTIQNDGMFHLLAVTAFDLATGEDSDLATK